MTAIRWGFWNQYRWWNFWSRHDAALYGFRAWHPLKPGKKIFAYGGKTIQQPWTSRIKDHMWGGGRYDQEAQPWADTVLGWTPNGTVDDLIAAGGVFLIWKGRCSPFSLWWREIVFAIWLRRPYYNYQWNLHNPRRIPIPEQEIQREFRDQGIMGQGSSTIWPRLGMWTRLGGALAALILAVAMFLPGMPGSVGVELVQQWLAAHSNDLLVGAVLVGTVLLVVAGNKRSGKRRRKRRRVTRRRSRRRQRSLW